MPLIPLLYSSNRYVALGNLKGLRTTAAGGLDFRNVYFDDDKPAESAGTAPAKTPAVSGSGTPENPGRTAKVQKDVSAPAPDKDSTAPASDKDSTAPASDKDSTAPASDKDSTAPASDKDSTAPAPDRNRAPAKGGS